MYLIRGSISKKKTKAPEDFNQEVDRFPDKKDKILSGLEVRVGNLFVSLDHDAIATETGEASQPQPKKKELSMFEVFKADQEIEGLKDVERTVTARASKGSKYPVATMEVGEKFFVPAKGKKTPLCCGAMYAEAKKSGRKFSYSKKLLNDVEGFLIERTA